jgi:hypothetical protein
VKLVAETFVPVALNADRLPKSDDGDFFRTLKKQWPQGLWAVTPDGKVLGFHYHRPKPGESYAEGQKRWVRETVEMARTAAKEAGPVTPWNGKGRPDPLADRGRGFDAEEGIRLALTVTSQRNGRTDGSPVWDSILLDAEKWKAFGPPAGTATVGQTWAAPEAIARTFTPALSPMTDPIFSPTPSDAKTAKITAKVSRIGTDGVVVRYTGEWATAHNRDGDPKFPIRTAATGEGVGVFDGQTGKIAALVWLVKGNYRNSPPDDQPRSTAAVIEWAVTTPGW